ncbi:MAG TPA: (2Fe-2S)-binding protein [Rudaea sp.]|nr:(2Fe-2S)-binding protein [Rudaea sp.]
MQDNPARHSKPTPVPPVAASALEKTLPLHINGKDYFSDDDPAMPLLWYLRDVLRLTGAKYACGIGACGACTVLVDGKAQASCMLPLKQVAGHAITTIEGLAGNAALHPLQQAWIDEDVILCGYCQTGQIMAAAALLRRTDDPGDADIDKIANLCRCGSYPRLRKAIKRAATASKAAKKK